MLNTRHFIIINNNKKNLLLLIFFSVRERGEHILQSDRPRERAEFSHVSSLSENLLDDLCYYVSKNLSVEPLSSTWIISVFITICSLEIVQFVANLATITALKCSGLSHAFGCVIEKKNVIHQPRSVRVGKNCALCLEYRYPRPRAQFFPIRTSRLVNNL